MVLQRWRKIFESGDFDRLGEVYAQDCFFDVNIPTWRFQRQGRQAVVDQFKVWYGGKTLGIVNWVERPTESGAIVELEQAVGSGEDELFFRYINVFVLSGEMVSEHVIYCPGPWNRDARARWAAEETLIRP